MFPLVLKVIWKLLIIRERRIDSAWERRREAQMDSHRRGEAYIELLEIAKHIITDWNYNRYKDKITTPPNNGTHVIYNFENGESIELIKSYGKRKLTHRTFTHVITYTVGEQMWGTLLRLLNSIVDECNDGDATTRNGQSKSRPKQQTKSNKPNPHANHPKWDRYWGLITNIRQRTTNLDEMSKNDDSRSGLINELNTAKRQAKAMKEKYNF